MATNASSIFQFKVSLKNIKPQIWRRIQVPSNYNFKQLHLVIQNAMGWHSTIVNYHLHAFRMKDPRTARKIEIGIPDDSGFDADVISGDEAQLTRYFLTEKAKAVYEYDFGDGWEHNLVLEKIIPAEKGEEYPKCIDGKRACPPEDCGGIDGYDRHVKIVSNKRHPEYKEHMEWLGKVRGATDPEFFDPKAVEFNFSSDI